MGIVEGGCINWPGSSRRLDFTHLQAYVAGWNAAMKQRRTSTAGPDWGETLFNAWEDYASKVEAVTKKS